MATWRVFKQGHFDEQIASDRRRVEAWVEVGEHESDSDWYPGYQAAQAVGEQFGAGEFMLIVSGRVTFMTIGVRQDFYEVEKPEPIEDEEVEEEVSAT